MATATKVQPISVVKETGEDLANKTVCLKVRFGMFGNVRKVSNSQVQVDADKQLIKVNKILLDSDELEAVRKADAQVRQYVQTAALPIYYDIGIVLLPLGMVDQVVKELKRYRQEREELVQKFLLKYPELCRNAQLRLRGLHNPMDYPSKREVEKKFYFSWKFISFGTPGQLQRISATLFEEEREKANKEWNEAVKEITVGMRVALAELVSHLTERLQTITAEDGAQKPKRIHETAVTKLQEFLNNFNLRNVTDDEDLREEVERLKGIMGGVSVEALRTTDTLRDSIRTQLTKVGKTLESMIGDAPIRKIKLEED